MEPFINMQLLTFLSIDRILPVVGVTLDRSNGPARNVAGQRARGNTL